MTNFGKITTFDVVSGRGTIQPEGSEKIVRFGRTSLGSLRQDNALIERRMSYEDSTDEHGKACAINLQPA